MQFIPNSPIPPRGIISKTLLTFCVNSLSGKALRLLSQIWGPQQAEEYSIRPAACSLATNPSSLPPGLSTAFQSDSDHARHARKSTNASAFGSTDRENGKGWSKYSAGAAFRNHLDTFLCRGTLLRRLGR